MDIRSTISAVDSHGVTYTCRTFHPERVVFAVIMSYPARAATTFSSAVEFKRDLAITAKTIADARRISMHHAKQFGAFDIEIVVPTIS